MLEILGIALKVLVIALAFLMSALYVAVQLWQKLPQEAFKLKTHDLFVLITVSLLLGFGLDSYWGLLGFVPLLAIKFCAHRFIRKNRVHGSGRWMEIQWQRMMPRGFQLPANVMQDLKKLPGDTHVLLPRWLSLLAVKYFTKAMRKQEGNLPAHLRGNQAQANEMVEKLSVSLTRLSPGGTERLNLPFGVLRVTRL